MYVYIYIDTASCVYKDICIQYTTYLHICMYKDICMKIYVCKDIYLQSNLNTYIKMCIQDPTRVCIKMYA